MNKKSIGLALSGGGFRASVFHIGVLKYLAEKEKLEEVSYISTVSGGSLLIGLIYSLNNYKWPSSKEFLEIVLPELEKKLTETSLFKDALKNLFKSSNLKYILNRANLLSYTLEKNWGINEYINNINSFPKLVFNATTSETGKSWRFSNDKMGDYISGYVENPNMKISDIMAISAAFPAGIGPFKLKSSDYKWFKYKNWNDMKKNNCTPIYENIHLYDGGVYDNLGVEPMISNTSDDSFLRKDIDYLIVSDASKPLSKCKHSKSKIKRTIRLLDITTDQTRSLRARMLFKEFSNSRNGLYIKIGHTKEKIFSDKKISYKKDSFKDLRFLNKEASSIAESYPTNLNKVTSDKYKNLLEHGYAVMSATSFAYDFK